MSQPPIIPLKSIPTKDRVSMVFVYYGRIDVKDGAFVVINEVGGVDQERKHIPVGSVACIMLEPGTRIYPKPVVLKCNVIFSRP
jgi:CRISPR-associated protein Cas1